MTEDATAKAGIVLLHGRGGTAGGMRDLWAAAGITGVEVRAPAAAGNSWWPTSFLAPEAVVGPPRDSALSVVKGEVEALEAQGIPRQAIWLLGFSQGACLAAEALARFGAGLAGAFVFSGGLLGTGDSGEPPADDLLGQVPKHFAYDGRRDGARVWLSVHERDPHIPLRRVRETADVFAALGAEVVMDIRHGTGHSVDQTDLATLRRWLAHA
jgi:phospholipase/carboxylesterase